jgi:hypothetical protein
MYLALHRPQLEKVILKCILHKFITKALQQNFITWRGLNPWFPTLEAGVISDVPRRKCFFVIFLFLQVIVLRVKNKWTMSWLYTIRDRTWLKKNLKSYFICLHAWKRRFNEQQVVVVTSFEWLVRLFLIFPDVDIVLISAVERRKKIWQLFRVSQKHRSLSNK